jgi:surfeit locus 1 family protein
MMPPMIRFRPHPWLTLASLPAFALLVVLGNWQMDRMAWKHDLIATVEARTMLNPAPLPEVLAKTAATPDAIEYRPVRVEGVFDHAREIHVFAYRGKGQAGYHIITPLATAQGWVLVNRGFVPTSRKDAATRAAGQVEGVVTVTGLARPPGARGPFTPPDDPQGNVWFARDVDAMAAHLGIDLAAPVIVEADASPNPGGLPQGGITQVEFRDNHLGYAITWYGLAAALLFVYAGLHLSQGRLRLGRGGRP